MIIFKDSEIFLGNVYNYVVNAYLTFMQISLWWFYEAGRIGL